MVDGVVGAPGAKDRVKAHEQTVSMGLTHLPGFSHGGLAYRLSYKKETGHTWLTEISIKEGKFSEVWLHNSARTPIFPAGLDAFSASDVGGRIFVAGSNPVRRFTIRYTIVGRCLIMCSSLRTRILSGIRARGGLRGGRSPGRKGPREGARTNGEHGLED